VPYPVTNKNNIRANIELRKVYTGQGDPIDHILYDGYVAERVDVTDKNGTIVSPEQYKVFY
jgi:hypothetical protein